jgi:hypothetical protein
MNYKTAKMLITMALTDKLQPSPDIEHYKLQLMLRTGVQATTKEGRVFHVTPTGLNLEWLMKALREEESPYTKVQFTGKRCEILTERAELDSVAWDAAKTLAAKIHQQGGTLPVELRPFAPSIIKRRNRPLKKGRKEQENLYRDQCIGEVIYSLYKAGFKPITKNSNSTNRNSACHAVADVLATLKIGRSYGAIKTIWRKYKKFYCSSFPAIEVSTS